MEHTILLNTLERVLGKGHSSSSGNYKFYCPNCNHHKQKLEINLDTQQWACWICGNRDSFKGKSLKSLFKKLNVSTEILAELKYTSTDKEIQIKPSEAIALPKEFIPLTSVGLLSKIDQVIAKHALKYLKARNISKDDIIKYNIGFCNSGKYMNRVIIPSYDSVGKLNYFVGRSWEEDSMLKYKNPKVHKDNIIGFELYINFDAPIILCEGVFDAIAIKRNAIPLLGKTISSALMKKLVISTVKNIYIALDTDALNDAITHAETLMNAGKIVYLVELNDKDPSQLGFDKFIEIISQTQPLTLSGLMAKKLKL
jgi:DNA primase